MRGSTATAIFLLCACGQSGNGPQAKVTIEALFSVPSTGVNCIQIVATGGKRTVTQNFSVAAGQSTATLAMSGVPDGNVLFSGSGFNEPCGQIASASVATWLGDNVSATVTPGSPATVAMTFRPNGRATVAGNFADDQYTSSTPAGLAGTAGPADGTGAAARLEGPGGSAYDGADTLYFADRNFTSTGASAGMTIRKLSISSGAVSTLAGNSSAVGTSEGSSGGAATFVRLFAVGLSADNSSLYIADKCALRKMSTVAPYPVTTVLGTRSADGTNWVCGGGAWLDIVVRATSIYLVDSNNAVVSKVPLTGTPALTAVAGISGNPGANDGSLTTARFLSPNGLVFPNSSDDVFYVLDVGNSAPDGVSGSSWGTVRRVVQSANTVTTIAGAPQTGNQIRDGVGTGALFVQPRRAVSDGASLFIGDAFAVRRMDLSTGAVVTIMGGNTAGSADGVGTAALVNAPFGISRNGTSGALYLSDQGNFTIRVLAP